MTPQKAIDLVHCCMPCIRDNITEARTMAIKALEKQIPFKPEINDLKVGVGRCKCGAEFLDRETNYCGNCGQALDWGDEKMIEEKYYYKITNQDGTVIYASTDIHVKSNKLCEILGMDDYTAVEITKQEYDEDTEDEE